MSRKKILSEEELAEAKRLKDEEKFSNRKLAKHFEVGKTTIWDNLFATARKPRIQVRRPKFSRCSECGILHNDVVQTANRQIGGLCLGCCVQRLKKHEATSGQIAKFLNIELGLVNKYWFIVKKDEDLDE